MWLLEKFDPYLIGNDFDAHVDCKAVELIFNNPLSKPPTRILRWAMRAGHYRAKIIHTPGLGNIADFLSKHPLKELKSDSSQAAENFVNIIVNYSLPLAISKQQILEETLKD